MSFSTRIGCAISMRRGGFTLFTSKRFGLGPIKLMRLVTNASRIGSIGGFVT